MLVEPSMKLASVLCSISDSGSTTDSVAEVFVDQLIMINNTQQANLEKKKKNKNKKKIKTQSLGFNCCIRLRRESWRSF